jgi:hypothetical protein
MTSRMLGDELDRVGVSALVGFVEVCVRSWGSGEELWGREFVLVVEFGLGEEVNKKAGRSGRSANKTRQTWGTGDQTRHENTHQHLHQAAGIARRKGGNSTMRTGG